MVLPETISALSRLGPLRYTGVTLNVLLSRRTHGKSLRNINTISGLGA